MISLDDSHWPLLTMTFSGTLSTEDFDAYLARRTAYLKRGERHLTLFDGRLLTTGPNLEQRQRQIDWNHRHLSALRQHSVGSVFILTSPFIRLTLNIMFQLQPLPAPHMVVGEMTAALAWATQRLQAGGLRLPSFPVSEQGQAGDICVPLS